MIKERAIAEMKQRIDRGIAYLDKTYPNWWDKVEVGNLDMSTHTYCVLAQIHGTNVEITPECQSVDMFQMGFAAGYNTELPFRQHEMEFNRIWRNKIRERQSRQ